MRKPEISFIVSSYARPIELTICLKSLELQRTNCEILIADNKGSSITQDICDGYAYYDTSKKCKDCYQSANLLAKEARGKYLCFPSDDNYYTPFFAERLLAHAKRFKLDLVYCDFIQNPTTVGSYEVFRAQPIIGHIDKGGFLVKRDKFPGFPTGSARKDVFADGLMIEQLRGTGIRFGKVNDVLWVHN